MAMSENGERLRVKAGWDGAGRTGRRLGPDVMCDSRFWTPVKWDDEDDPDWNKATSLEVVLDGPEEERLLRELAGEDAQAFNLMWHTGSKSAAVCSLLPELARLLADAPRAASGESTWLRFIDKVADALVLDQPTEVIRLIAEAAKNAKESGRVLNA